jgi:hypothetical protein
MENADRLRRFHVDEFAVMPTFRFFVVTQPVRLSGRRQLDATKQPLGRFPSNCAHQNPRSAGGRRDFVCPRLTEGAF